MILFRLQRILSISESFDIWLVGVKGMMQPVLTLILSWGLGKLCQDLATDRFLMNLADHRVDPVFLPSLVFIATAFGSFCTGTSWGTASIFLPLAAPLSYRLGNRDRDIFLRTIAAVFSGAVFGDHWYVIPLSVETCH
jgi:Na+/H+ antiporter NhaC